MSVLIFHIEAVLLLRIISANKIELWKTSRAICSVNIQFSDEACKYEYWLLVRDITINALSHGIKDWCEAQANVEAAKAKMCIECM